MNCTSCGANLPPGAKNCPVCGMPTPYNTTGPASNPSPYDPTVAASAPYGNQGPQSNPGNPYDPTVAASGPYGNQGPQSNPNNPYGSNNPPSYPPTDYGTPPPPQYPGQQSANPNPYAPSDPYAPAPNAYPNQAPQPGTYPGQPAPKRRSRVGMIIAIVAGVLIVACCGIAFAVYQVGKNAADNLNATATAVVQNSQNTQNTATAGDNATATANANATAAVTPTSSSSGNSNNPPSGQTIDPTASGIITDPQMASAIDNNTTEPTKLTTTFAVKQTIYATFKIDHGNGGHDGYAEAKWYADGTYVFTSKILHAQTENPAGEFAAYFNIPTNGTVEFYWCTQSDCSDAKLAQVATFTVTTSGMRPVNPPAVAFMDSDRRNG